MSEFTDYHGVVIKKGDKINLEIFGVGSGEAEIVEKDNELQIYEPSQGYYPLSNAVIRSDMRIIVL